MERRTLIGPTAFQASALLQLHSTYERENWTSSASCMCVSVGKTMCMAGGIIIGTLIVPMLLSSNETQPSG